MNTKTVHAIASELMRASASGGTISTTDTSVPSVGYVVGIVGQGITQSGNDVSAIAQWVALHLDASHFGVWSDSETGITYLDVVEVIADRTAAESLARDTGEIAIWDLANREEIRV